MAEKLKESDYRYELAMQGSNAGLWDWDIKRNQIFHGPKWYDMLGYDENNFHDASIENIYEIIHPDDLPGVREALTNQMEKDIPYSVELRMKRKDGTFHWFLDSGKVIRENGNGPIRMVGSIIDIQERKKAESEVLKQNELLEKANSELDRFVYITSHDLKAPLLSVMGLINLAQMSGDPNEIEMCLRLMKERIKGLEHFIGDIIDYSRNARSGIISDEIYLKSMIEDILKEMIFVDDADKITISLDIPAEFRFLSDSKRLSVIMKNLIFNSIKYHDPAKSNPSIEIKAVKSEESISIRVIDNGIGVDHKMKDKIFDMFYRASEKSNGSGLGLYIVKEMVLKLNGSIEVISEPSKGTEFRLSFPVTI
jgi:PAS domain S-box-containing protein